MLTLLQVLLAAAVLAVIGRRCYLLCVRWPLSDDALREVLSAAARGDDALLARASERSPQSHIGQLLRARLAGKGEESRYDTAELLSELRASATARLDALRMTATIASTLGLLVAITALVEGFSSENAGLLALEEGLPEKVAMGRALWAMGLGVGVSALCFFALGRLRPAARSLIQQLDRAAAALGIQKL